MRAILYRIHSGARLSRPTPELIEIACLQTVNPSPNSWPAAAHALSLGPFRPAPGTFRSTLADLQSGCLKPAGLLQQSSFHLFLYIFKGVRRCRRKSIPDKTHHFIDSSKAPRLLTDSNESHQTLKRTLRTVALPSKRLRHIYIFSNTPSSTI